MKKITSTADIKVGVIGYGGIFNMGRIHLTDMQKTGMVPYAVAELDPARLEAAKADFPGINTFATTDALCASDVDLVVIVTPHDSHGRLALQALRAGKHVICEKPMAITTEECDEMIALAASRGLCLSVYHCRHWDAHIVKAVECIKHQRMIGEIYRIDAHMGGYHPHKDWWRSSKKASGGALYDWGVHLLEYVFQLIDAPITEVSGFAHSGFWKTHWDADTIEDDAYFIARFANGVCLTLNITALNPALPWSIMELHGTKGVYQMGFEKYQIVTKDEHGSTHTSTNRNGAAEWFRYYENIAAHLVHGEPLVITPELGRRCIQVIETAQQSAKAGHAIRLEGI